MWQNTKGWSGWPWSGGKWQTSGWKRLAGISGAANDALRAFYDAMGGDSWTDNTGWGTSSAAYFGVTISSGTVTAISLPGNNLDGDAGTTLDPLAGTLAVLDLGQNTALDDIDVSALTALANIDLAGCDFGSSVVAGILADVVTAGVSSGTLDIGGSNSSPTPAGVTALLALEDDSWTLTYSTVIMETTGTAATINTGTFKCITADGDATIHASAADLSSYVGCKITLTDSSGYTAYGWGHAADDAEALGAAAVDDDCSADGTASWTKYDCTLTFDTDHYVFTRTAATYGAYKQFSALTSGNLYKGSITTKLGTIASVNSSFYFADSSGAQSESFSTGADYATNTLYINSSGLYRFGILLDGGINGDTTLMQGISLKQVTALGADALQIRSTPGGSTRNWAYKHASFNPNSIASITVTKECYAITADGDATIRLGGLDLSGQTGKYIVVKDTAGKYATAYGHAQDDAEALGAELITNGIFAADTSWTKQPSWTIAAGVATYDDASNHSIQPTNAISTSVNDLVKCTFDIGGAATFARVAFYSNIEPVGFIFSFLDSYADLVNGSYSYTGYVKIAEKFQFYANIAGTAFNWDNVSLKKYTALGTDALQLRSTASGSTRNWASKETGFNPNSISKIEVFNAE